MKVLMEDIYKAINDFNTESEEIGECSSAIYLLDRGHVKDVEDVFRLTRILNLILTERSKLESSSLSK